MKGPTWRGLSETHNRDGSMCLVRTYSKMAEKEHTSSLSRKTVKNQRGVDLKHSQRGAGEMSQWLRALVALAEDPGSV